MLKKNNKKIKAVKSFLVML